MDILHADAVDGETVRVELDGAAHDIDEETAHQLARDLDAAIDQLESQDEQDDEVSEGFVETLTRADSVGPTVAKRVAQQFDSLDEVAKSNAEELEDVEGLGPNARMSIQDLSL